MYSVGRTKAFRVSDIFCRLNGTGAALNCLAGCAVLTVSPFAADHSGVRCGVFTAFTFTLATGRPRRGAPSACACLFGLSAEALEAATCVSSTGFSLQLALALHAVGVADAVDEARAVHAAPAAWFHLPPVRFVAFTVATPSHARRVRERFVAAAFCTVTTRLTTLAAFATFPAFTTRCIGRLVGGWFRFCCSSSTQ